MLTPEWIQNINFVMIAALNVTIWVAIRDRKKQNKKIDTLAEKLDEYYKQEIIADDFKKYDVEEPHRIAEAYGTPREVAATQEVSE